MASTSLIEMMVAKALVKDSTFIAKFADDTTIDTFLGSAVDAIDANTILSNKFGWMLGKSDFHRGLIDNAFFPQAIEEAILFGSYVSGWVYVYGTSDVTNLTSTLAYTYSATQYTGKTWWQTIYGQEGIISTPRDLTNIGNLLHVDGVTEDDQNDSYYLWTNANVKDSWGVPIYESAIAVPFKPTEDGMPISETTVKHEIDGSHIGDVSKYVIRPKIRRT